MNQEAAFRGMASNIGGHYDGNSRSTSGGEGKSWFGRQWDKLFGGKSTATFSFEGANWSDVVGDAVSDTWNSFEARKAVPDRLYVNVSFNSVVGVGTDWDFSLNWITRGNDASFAPYAITTVGGAVACQMLLLVLVRVLVIFL